MGELPAGWREMTLEEAASWHSGGTPPTSEPLYWNGDIPWITSGSLTEFHLKASERTLTEKGVAAGSRLVPPGTTIFVVRGMSLKTEFRIGITTKPMAFGQDCKALRPVEGIDELFLAYAIKARSETVLDLVDEAGHGTGRLNTDQMKALAIEVPPHAEQRAIAEVLGALDDKIESNRRLLATSGLVLHAEADRMVGPKVPLGAIAEVAREVMDPQKLGDVAVDHFSIPAFDAGERPDRVLAQTIKSGKTRVDGNAILLSRLNPRFPRLWHAVPEPGVLAVCSTEFMVLSPAPGLTIADLWLACSQATVRDEMVQRATGTSGSHQRVRPNDVLAMEVVDPRALADAIREEAGELLELAEAARRENEFLAALRDALLPELLAGRLRVPEAEKMAEAVL